MTTSLECIPAYSTPSHTHKASRKINSKKTTNSLFESPFSNINGPIYFGERRQMPKLMIRLGQDFCTSSAICINLKVWVKVYNKSNQSLKGYINKSQQSKKRSPGERKGYPFQYSGLEQSMDCIVHGVTKRQTQLTNFHFQELVSVR